MKYRIVAIYIQYTYKKKIIIYLIFINCKFKPIATYKYDQPNKVINNQRWEN